VKHYGSPRWCISGSVCVESNVCGSLLCRGSNRLRWFLFSRRCAGYVHRQEVLVAPRVEDCGLAFAWYAWCSYCGADLLYRLVSE
jgi:hypothetical protein